MDNFKMQARAVGEVVHISRVVNATLRTTPVPTIKDWVVVEDEADQHGRITIVPLKYASPDNWKSSPWILTMLPNAVSDCTGDCIDFVISDDEKYASAFGGMR